jgi:hypothetical protein
MKSFFKLLAVLAVFSALSTRVVGQATSPPPQPQPNGANTQTTGDANSPKPPVEVLFSDAFTQMRTNDSIIIQLGEGQVLVFDKPGPYTLFDPVSGKPRKLIIVAPQIAMKAQVVIDSFDFGDVKQRPPQKAALAQATHGQDANDAGNCNGGGSGTPGTSGLDGDAGDTGFSAPLIVLDIGKIQVANGGSLLINDKGGTGGQGQNGQQGGDGGRAGRGGDSVDHLTGCACGPGTAGQPGPAAAGGRGGSGGSGGAGGTVLVSSAVKSANGPTSGIRIDVSHGDNGPAGESGKGGRGGKGATGGSGSTYCNAGAQGSSDAADLSGTPNSVAPAPLPHGLDGATKLLGASAWLP